MRISGDDRESFLQGQLTQDVSALPPGGSAPAAWCSPKGRVIVTGRLLALDAAFAFVVLSDSIDAVLRRLTMYRLRSKVDLAVDEGIISRALSRDALPASASNETAVVDLTGDTVEVHGSREAWSRAGLDPDAALPESTWQVERIRAGLVDIGAQNTERYTPHMINLDKTGAISFSKGCYTGQEVVARTEHLGRVKRRVFRFSSAADGVAIGSRLMDGEREAGTVVNAAGGELLAIVSTADSSTELTVDGVAATPEPLPYPID